MKYRSGFIALALFAGSTANCLAQGVTRPTVTFTGGAGTSDYTSGWFPTGGVGGTGGWAVHVNIRNPIGTINCFVVSDDDEPIHDLAIDFISTNFDVNLHVTGDTTTNTHSVRAIYPENVAGGDLILTELLCDGGVDSIRVHRIVSADIGGDLGIAAPAGGVLLMDPTTGTADIIELNVAGHMLGHIGGHLSAEIDTIVLLDVGGNIGTSGDPSPIEANKIDYIIAENIYADITLNTTANNGRVRHIETRPGFDFVGSLTMSEFHNSGGTGLPGLFIGGDLDADITITNDLHTIGEINVTGAFTSGNTINIEEDAVGDMRFGGIMSGTINIDEGLIGDITIIAASGLVGQIIVNSADGGNVWSNASTVKVGMTVLSPEPHYPQIGLGGGAVGLVAFDCHFQDCFPAATSSTPGILGDSSSNVAFKVTLTHYGPVTWTSDMPIQVLFCPAGAECDPTDVTDDFEVTSSQEQRFVVVEPIEGKPAAGEYHFSPKVDVKCFGISAGTPPSVVSYTYNLEFNMN